MDKFLGFKSKAHSFLSLAKPRLTLSQTGEILAAAFGHNTYASFAEKDKTALDSNAKYILVDDAKASERAEKLGFRFSSEEWDATVCQMKVSPVAGNSWLIREEEMHHAARLVFEDATYQFFDDIARSLGMPDQRKANHIQRLLMIEELPDELKFSIEGEIRSITQTSFLSVPVKAEVYFEKLGERLYAEGNIRSFEISGQPFEYEQDNYDVHENLSVEEGDL